MKPSKNGDNILNYVLDIGQLKGVFDKILIWQVCESITVKKKKRSGLAFVALQF